MGKVTALHMDTITEKSGHQMTGMAVSVCLTPAAPSPLPIPYPTMGTVAEGIIDPCMRTKIEGAKILTVGGCMKACHGNEPGTLKEVVSLNTGGPCFPWLGAPNVLIELGMAGITGSMGQMNKSITVGAGVSASNAAGGGGGGSSAGGPGGGGPQGPGNGGGGGGGSSQGAGPPSPPAPPGADGQASAGHPIDVVSGAMYTNPVEDLELPGPLVLTLERSYSTAAVRHRCGIGWGWSHDLAWSARRRGDELELAAPGGRAQVLSWPAQDQVLFLPFGVRVAAAVGEDLLVEDDDGLVRVLRRAAPGRARGRGAGWARSRRSRTASAARASTTSTSRAGRSASTASAPTSSSRTRPRERRSRRAAPRGRSAGTAAPCARAAPRSSGTPVAASQRAPVRGRCRPGATSTTSATASSQRSAATASSSVTCTTPSAAASRRRTATARAPGSAGTARASSRNARRRGRRSSACSTTTASRRSSRRATARTGGWS